MKDAVKNKMSIAFTFLLLSCVQLTKEENETMLKLNAQFPLYEFSKPRDLSDAYLRVKVLEPFVDSVELKAIYDKIDQIKNKAIDSGHPHINWTYLVIFDKNNDYLFTIVKNDSIIFFKDAVR